MNQFDTVLKKNVQFHPKKCFHCGTVDLRTFITTVESRNVVSAKVESESEAEQLEKFHHSRLLQIMAQSAPIERSQVKLAFYWFVSNSDERVQIKLFLTLK